MKITTFYILLLLMFRLNSSVAPFLIAGTNLTKGLRMVDVSCNRSASCGLQGKCDCETSLCQCFPGFATIDANQPCRYVRKSKAMAMFTSVLLGAAGADMVLSQSWQCKIHKAWSSETDQWWWWRRIVVDCRYFSPPHWFVPRWKWDTSVVSFEQLLLHGWFNEWSSLRWKTSGKCTSMPTLVLSTVSVQITGNKIRLLEKSSHD